MDARLELYKRTLLEWNEKINLIGPEAREHLDDHIAEALAAAAILKPQGEVLDFGSGGGLPAIPMAIVSPAAHFHLVEADRKKWAFLKHVVRECGLRAVVHGDRLARALTRLPPEVRFQLITSRAVGSPADWIPLLKPVLADRARVALFQGNEGAPAIEGFTVERVDRLPRGEANLLMTLMFHVEQ